MRTTLFFLPSFALSFILLASCGNENSTDKETPAASGRAVKTASFKMKWPSNDFTTLAPKPEVGVFRSRAVKSISSGASYCEIEMEWTPEEMKAYARQAKAAGFTELGGDSGEKARHIYTFNNEKAAITITRTKIMVNKKIK